MSRPAPLRHVRTIVGVFNLAILALLLVGIVFVGRGRRWFEKHAVLHVTFPANHAAVLRVGVPVKLAGDPVGKVAAAVREGGVIRSTLAIGAAARETLRADARAHLRVPIAGLVGDLSVALDAGSAPAPWPEGKVMTGEAEGDPAVKAGETVDRVREQVPALLERTQAILDKTDAILGQVQRSRAAEDVDRLVRSLDRLARSVEQERAVANASATLARLEELLRGLRDGKGSAGKLFTDPLMYDRTAVLLDDVHRSWGKIDALVGQTTQLAQRADELAQQARGRTREFEQLVAEIQLLVMQSNHALDLVANNWFLRGSVPEPGPPLPPAVLDLPEADVRAGGPVAGQPPRGAGPGKGRP
jgi:phospholipid/cholesterol/gamma-HCH transport system substrate-binding protein